MKELEKKNKIPGLSGMYLWSDPFGGHSFCIYVKDEERNSPKEPDVYSDDAPERRVAIHLPHGKGNPEDEPQTHRPDHDDQGHKRPLEKVREDAGRSAPMGRFRY